MKARAHKRLLICLNHGLGSISTIYLDSNWLFLIHDFVNEICFGNFLSTWWPVEIKCHVKACASLRAAKKQVQRTSKWRWRTHESRQDRAVIGTLAHPWSKHFRGSEVQSHLARMFSSLHYTNRSTNKAALKPLSLRLEPLATAEPGLFRLCPAHFMGSLQKSPVEQ